MTNLIQYEKTHNDDKGTTEKTNKEIDALQSNSIIQI